MKDDTQIKRLGLPEGWKQWQPGDPITINRIVWGERELELVLRVFERDWFGPSAYAEMAETFLSRLHDDRPVQLLNSGSSALLLAARAFQRLGLWKRGDKILTPVCTFPSTANPIWQAGMLPVFVDVEEGTYNISAQLVRQAVAEHPDIAGAIIPHLIGNVPEMHEILVALQGRPLLEDCCDTLVGRYDGRIVGTFGDAAAFSFYGSHHVTAAGVGGALVCAREDVYDVVHSMCFWGRDFAPTGDAYADFLCRYRYRELGYDMQMTEIQAAFLVAQFENLLSTVETRAARFAQLNEALMPYDHLLLLPRQHGRAEPSWFGFPVLVREDAPFDREHFARHLLDNKVEIRPLFAGNLIRQPAYARSPYILIGDTVEADRCMDRALFLPAWNMPPECMATLISILTEYLRSW